MGEGKRLEREEEPSIIFLKATSYQKRHVFRKYAQDDLQGSLGSCGPNPYKALSASHRFHYACKVVSQQGCTGLPLSSHSLRGKNLETRWWNSGVRGNGSLQREAAALQPLATFLHVEPETMWLSQIKSRLSGGDK